MIKIAAVDDEKIVMTKLSDLLDKYIEQEKVIDCFNSSTSFFNSAEKFSYDIVFLDIDMPEINGFVIAGDLKSINSDVAVIFVSNLENLIIDSIRYKPLAFIRKSSIEQDLEKNLDLIINSLQKTSKVFHVEINDVNKEISLNDIIYFESLNHDFYVHTMYNSYKKKRGRNSELNLKSLFEKYGAEGFILVNRSYLVNYRYIDVINHDDIVLKNKTRIKISCRNVAAIKRIYQQFLMTGGLL